MTQCSPQDFLKGGGGRQSLWQGGGERVRDYLAFVFIAAPLVKR